eukprot:4672571-Pleurochrysis_carterae.AAC.1
MTVVLVRRLPFTASEVSVTQCMPAPVSPSHIALVPIAAMVGSVCIAEEYIACVSAFPRRCAIWSLNAASPRVMSA